MNAFALLESNIQEYRNVSLTHDKNHKYHLMFSRKLV